MADPTQGLSTPSNADKRGWRSVCTHTGCGRATRFGSPAGGWRVPPWPEHWRPSLTVGAGAPGAQPQQRGGSCDARVKGRPPALSPAGPVAFSPLVVRNGQDSHHVSGNPVEQAVREPIEDISAGSTAIGRPPIGRPRHLLDGVSQLSEEP